MKFNIITIFPDIFNSYFEESIIKNAIKRKIIKIQSHDLRKWTKDKHKKVDDTPYGGGAGMLMKIEPLYRAIQEIKRKNKNTKILLMSAKGERWTQQEAKKYSKEKNITIICGRYEGIDERINNFIDKEISIGDYILTGGEIPAMVMVDSITRLLPKVLGNKESIEEESHSIKGNLEYPQFTKPSVFIANKKQYKVPSVLLSGNHKKIKEWREKNSKKVS